MTLLGELGTSLAGRQSLLRLRAEPDAMAGDRGRREAFGMRHSLPQDHHRVAQVEVSGRKRGPFLMQG